MATTFNPDNVTLQNAKTGQIPTEIAEGIITEVQTGSAYMQLAKEVQMDKPIKEFTYMTGVGAYWVDEANVIKTSKPTFVKAKMQAYKMGVIIPTTKENLQYSLTDFFTLMQPEIAQAFHNLLDQAAFAGVNSPFAQNILKSATDASQLVTQTSDVYNDLNNALAFVEANDLDPNGIAATNKQKTIYRGAKDTNGYPIFNSANDGAADRLLGLPVAYLPNSTFGNTDIAEIVGEWNNAFYGVLQGIEYTVLDQATLSSIKDEDGEPINLAERDMFALRATMHVGIMLGSDNAFSVVTKAATTPPDTTPEP